MSKRTAHHVTGRYRDDLPPPAERGSVAARVRRPGCVLVVALLIAGLSAAATAALVLFMLLRPQPVRSHNAVWLGIDWGQAVQEDAAVRDLTDNLKAQGIDTLYVWTTWLQEDATWSPTTFQNMAAFLDQVRQFYPEVRLDAWLGIPVELPDYRLDDEDLRAEIARFSAQALADFGFDGIHINAEPVWDGDEGFLSLLREVRLAIGNDVVLSVAVPPDWNTGDPAIPAGPYTTPDAHWAQEYKQRVGFLADELAIMAYNSGLASPLDYQTWMAYQVNRYVSALAPLDVGTRLVIGVPTYDAELPGHDPAVESLQAAISGILQAMAASDPDGTRVQGVGIYAYWSTDPIEWNTYQRLWLTREAQ